MPVAQKLQIFDVTLIGQPRPCKKSVQMSKLVRPPTNVELPAPNHINSDHFDYKILDKITSQNKRQS